MHEAAPRAAFAHAGPDPLPYRGTPAGCASAQHRGVRRAPGSQARPGAGRRPPSPGPRSDVEEARGPRQRRLRSRATTFGAVRVLDWLLDSDPSLRWQVLRDLAEAPADVVAAERARVATEGWGARLLDARDPDGQWAGGACFPAAGWSREDGGQPWTSTLPTLDLLRLLGLDPGSAQAQETVALVGKNCRWEYD